MGLLDEAIRDHLELKRRRGADPAEVERAEQEALGPVRRTPDEVEREDVADEYPEQEYTEQEYTEEEDAEQIGAQPTQHFTPEEWEDEQPAGSEWSGEIASEPALEPESGHDPSPHPAAGAVELPEPEPAPQRDVEDRPLPPEGEQTVEYRLSDVEDGQEEPPARTAPPAEGDVLEETPEFLQDTPEHDRLWFEQRPPRDFDFED